MLPSHLPLVPHVDAAWTAHIARGSGLPLGHRHAAPGRRRQRAAAAGARAGVFAAHVVDAVAGDALACRFRTPARPASGRTCRSTQAMPVVAVRVGLAGLRALARDAAERVAVLDAPRLAGAQAVAGPGRVALVAGARRLDAHRVARELGAATQPIAQPGLTARGLRRRCDTGHGDGVALIHGPARPLAARQRARRARRPPLARDVADRRRRRRSR